jgi:hypothetical protein
MEYCSSGPKILQIHIRGAGRRLRDGGKLGRRGPVEEWGRRGRGGGLGMGGDQLVYWRWGMMLGQGAWGGREEGGKREGREREEGGKREGREREERGKREGKGKSDKAANIISCRCVYV